MEPIVAKTLEQLWKELEEQDARVATLREQVKGSDPDVIVRLGESLEEAIGAALEELGRPRASRAVVNSNHAIRV